MEETKEKVKNKKASKKPTIGDIVFRILVLGSIFFVCLIAYIYYIK